MLGKHTAIDKECTGAKINLVFLLDCHFPKIIAFLLTLPQGNHALIGVIFNFLCTSSVFKLQNCSASVLRPWMWVRDWPLATFPSLTRPGKAAQQSLHPTHHLQSPWELQKRPQSQRFFYSRQSVVSTLKLCKKSYLRMSWNTESHSVIFLKCCFSRNSNFRKRALITLIFI